MITTNSETNILKMYSPKNAENDVRNIYSQGYGNRKAWIWIFLVIQNKLPEFLKF